MSFEEILTELETHDVGTGAMLYLDIVHETNVVCFSFVCRCGDIKKDRKIRGKNCKSEIRKWDLYERLFMADWEPLSMVCFGRKTQSIWKKSSTLSSIF